VDLPVGVADGLPQAVQVIGPRHREDLCLDAGQAIEASLGIITLTDPRYKPGQSLLAGLREPLENGTLSKVPLSSVMVRTRAGNSWAKTWAAVAP
jgi:hypothetical protein